MSGARFALGPGVLLAVLSACEDTDPVDEVVIAPELAVDALGSALRFVATAAELATVLAAPVERVGGCPSASREGERWTFRYGVGCAPESGAIEGDWGGDVYATVPAGTGLFDGEAALFGPTSSPATATFVGQASALPGLVAGDLTFEEISWGVDNDRRVLAGLVGLDLADGQWSFDADGLRFETGPRSGLTLDLDGLSTAVGPISLCALPASGSMRIAVSDTDGTVAFESGAATLTLKGRDAVALPPLCP